MPPARSARSTRNPKAILEPDSDEVDEDVQGEDGDMDAEAADDEQPVENDEDEEDEEEEEEEEEEEDDDEEEDAEGEEDEEMADHPPPPVIKQTKSTTGKPNVTVTAPPEGLLKSVEAKEVDDDDEDDELSELDDNDLENPNEEIDDVEDDSDLDDELSRSATPDLSKLTRRQRGLYEENESADLMALSNEAQKKKHLSAEEHAMRRQEMARRRKNLSERRNEEEKVRGGRSCFGYDLLTRYTQMDTINKLLKKPAPKRRTRAEIIAAQQAEAMGTPGYEEGEEERPDALFTRYVQNRQGARLGVPEEWMHAPVGEMFSKYVAGDSGRMVEEVA